MDQKSSTQLPLDFDAPAKADSPPASKERGAKVFSFDALRFKRKPRETKLDDVDSVLEEVLSHAKKLNW
jgi:ADP-ribose pyrophosphatase YjhB (NUDIX family)